VQETYQDLWRALRLYSDALPTTLAQQFIRSRFRDIRRKRLWSWRVGQGQFIIPAAYTTGLALGNIGSQIVTGTGTNWTPSLVGLQFRFGTTAPIYTVIEVTNPTTLVIDMPYGGIPFVPNTGKGYQIFMGYLTPPTDFQDFLSVKDVFNNYRLALHLNQEWLDSVDAQRAQSGTPYGIVDFRYTYNPTQGSVTAQNQVAIGPGGPGSTPVFSGVYTGRQSTLYTVTITTGGNIGTAIFSWQEGSQPVNPGVLTDPAGLPFQMTDGVTIQFPVGYVFVAGDIFVCSAVPGMTLGLPQYELWPYQLSARVYPFTYDRRFTDLDDPNGIVPPYIDPDVIIKGALADVCRWRGTQNVVNRMYGLETAISYEKDFQARVAEMEREDDEVYLTDVRYQLQVDTALSFAPFPYGADYAQSHAVGSNTYF